MAGSPEVLELLEEMLDSGKTPEEVCRDRHELIPEVRRRWQEFRLIDEQLVELLPGLGSTADTGPLTPGLSNTDLPLVPGYEVEAVLGHGGMGVVYRARQQALDRPVAVKMLLAGPFASRQELGRFRRETAALASLRHPNIVQVYDAGDVDGRPYFAMELVEGGSLTQKLAGTPQPARPAAALVSTVAQAVEVAHKAGIIHRDLKPSNVLLTTDGIPKISDFGLARRLEGDDGLTRSGAVVGTPSYMAPEQAQGGAHVISPAVDVYALGTLLYECLTGRPPFRAESDLATLYQVVTKEPVPPSRLNSTVPRDLETICLKCLQKEPSRRYATAAALAADLDSFLRGEAILARPEGPVARLARRVRRRPALSTAVAVSVLLTGVLMSGGLWVLAERSAEKQANDAADAATERAAARDADEMVRWLRRSSWREAGVALNLAEGRLGERGSVGLRRRLDQGRRDLELALRLEAISAAAEGNPQAKTYDTECEALFRDAGLGLVSEAPAVVAARVQASDIRDALVRALDEWFIYAIDLTEAERQRREWIAEVARLSDPDPSGWRRLASDPNLLNDEAALDRFLKNAPHPFPSRPLLNAIQLQLLHEQRDPVPLLMRIQEAHPNDFSVNYRLGHYLTGRNPTEAVRYLQTAVSLRPNSAFAHAALGNALSKLGRLEEALPKYRRAEELAPSDPSNRRLVANCLVQLGRYDEAETQFRRDVAVDPQPEFAQITLRSFLVRHGRVDQALHEWTTAVPAAPTDYRIWNGYPELCLFAGRVEEYRKARKSILSRFGATDNPIHAAWASRSSLLLPAEGDEMRQAVALAERAAVADPRRYAGQMMSDFLFTQALADYRRGNFDRAITLLRGEAFPRTAHRLVLAMALHRAGKGAEARTRLAEAVLPHDWRASQAVDQANWLNHVLRREAESLILPNLQAFLAGTYDPPDNDERLALLGVCQFTNRTVALARLYADAFAADSLLAKDPGNGRRYVAARAAAQAGCGRGTDATSLGEQERQRWREQARRWLREDLAAWEQSLGGSAAGRIRAAETLTRWRADPDLGGLSAPAELARLSAEERKDCLTLWAEVEDLLSRPGGTAPVP